MNYGLSLIHSGVTSLSELPLTEDLRWISLHSNQITSIESISQLRNLTHLDLSANCISRMRGLDGLVLLKVLNLSCNQIKVVEGLRSLRNLKELDLSLNLIEDLTGFQDVKSHSHSLQKIVLFGNNIKSLTNAAKCLLGCGKLKVIDFKQGSDENPVCSAPNYRQYLFYQLPSLQALDGINRDGTLFQDKADIDQIPGIEDYLNLLIPSTSSTEKSTTTVVSTPKLDAALQKFKDVSLKGEEKSTEEPQGQDRGNITARLLAIENQITSFMNVYGPKEKERPAVTITLSSTSTSDDESAPDRAVETEPVRKDLSGRKSGLQHQPEKQTAYRKTTSTLKRPNVRKQGRREETNKNINGSNTAGIKVRDPRDDEEYLALMQELEGERERRWKAEQASRKFIDQIRQLQDQVSEEQKISESAIAAAAKLRQTLVSEKEAKDILQKASDSLKAENEECKASLKSMREGDEENRRALKAMEETAMKAEHQRIEEQALKAQQIQELQGKVSAQNHEVYLLRASNKEQKEQIQQLQSLIATREQEHKTKLDGMVHVDSREFQNRLERELAKQETRQTMLNQQYMNKLAEREREYVALEDEFRLALQIEARRFNELQSSHDQLMTRLKEKSEALELVSQKENKASSLVQELTALVKEQKGRLSEISRAKQEFQLQLKERINILEEELQELRKLPSRIDTLEQDKGKLTAQIRAQGSIIEGLRTERKLWGQELAQQGASLAQDRGRLESKIEALIRDLKHLEKQDEENKDTIKIKAKLIEDQTETIRKLKQAVADEQREKEEAKEELLAVQNEIEEEMKAEKVRNEDLQVTVDQLSVRKEGLKDEVSKLRSELDAAIEEKKALTTKWTETSRLISQMEQKVVKVKETFDTKETKLKKERDDAIEQLNSCSEKLREMQALMLQELDKKQKEHELEYRKLIVSKDKEIESMKEKVLDVEEEMRLLLKETNETKQKLEMKINRLGQAFYSIKDDLNK